MNHELRSQVLEVREADFEVKALEVFRYQARHCAVYRRLLELLRIDPGQVQNLQSIPFLPVEAFKSHVLGSDELPAQLTFTSSGTTGMITSQHAIADPSLYEESFLRAFHLFYGDVRDYCVLALLPSYLERSGSSLVYMAEALVKKSAHPDSGFYLHNYAELSEKLRRLESSGQRVLLLGVTYALLDLAEQFPQPLKHTIIMETGGMKGKRKEMVREELHAQLTAAFGVPHIHSEYGMTELLSQAYSKGEGVFSCPPWMRVQVRDVNDPFTILPAGRTGGLNIIDLANLYSCSFISVSDLGKRHDDGSFEVLGRFDHSDVRGCNLLVQ